MAIFSKIDGTNICPGLNYEELGATFNQALAFLLDMQKVERLGRLTVIKLCFWNSLTAKKAVYKTEWIINKCAHVFRHPSLSLHNAALAIGNNPPTVLLCLWRRWRRRRHDLTIAPPNSAPLFFLAIFCLFLFRIKREIKKKTGIEKGEEGEEEEVVEEEVVMVGGGVVDWTNKVHKRVHHLARQMSAPFALWDPAEHSCVIKDGLVPMAKGKEGAKGGGPAAKFSASGIRSASQGAKWPS